MIGLLEIVIFSGWPIADVMAPEADLSVFKSDVPLENRDKTIVISTPYRAKITTRKIFRIDLHTLLFYCRYESP